MPGTLLNTSHGLSHSISMRQVLFYPHVKDEEIEARKLKN